MVVYFLLPLPGIRATFSVAHHYRSCSQAHCGLWHGCLLPLDPSFPNPLFRSFECEGFFRAPLRAQCLLSSILTIHSASASSFHSLSHPLWFLKAALTVIWLRSMPRSVCWFWQYSWVRCYHWGKLGQGYLRPVRTIQWIMSLSVVQSETLRKRSSSSR